MLSAVKIARKDCEVVIGVNVGPDEVCSFFLEVTHLSANLKIKDEGAHRFRLSWVRNDKPLEEYIFDLSISCEGSLCDLHIKPASTEDLKKISIVVASVIEAMSSHGGVRVIEVRDYTQDEQGLLSDLDIQRVATYLQEHVLADLEQISIGLGMDPITTSTSLHRLINNGIIGCTRIGTTPIRLFYYK